MWYVLPMQNPETGELLPVPEDDPKNAPTGWPIYKVGERVKFRGWWWEIDSIQDGKLTVKPVKRDQKKRTSWNRTPKHRARRR
jgi:hypothetical protein